MSRDDDRVIFWIALVTAGLRDGLAGRLSLDPQPVTKRSAALFL